MLDIGPLVGNAVRLEPMELRHLDALTVLAADPMLWKWTPEVVSTPDAVRRYVEAALDERARGVSYPFVTIEQGLGHVVGSTRFANIVPAHRRLEIGWTWIAQPWQRSAINTEAKFLMLRCAFETLRYNRVEIKTDALNEKSRKAIERLGATFEGVFRRHVVCENGRVRDTAWYSITDAEWPIVKEGLLLKMASPGA